jgi:peptidoglycan/xylan/chitin deacetylase (PgdA/CDA1 family)
MIGVVANGADHEIVREFFELFKTPWEFYRPRGSYDVLLCAGEGSFDGTGKLVVVYSTAANVGDDKGGQTYPAMSNRMLVYRDQRIPVYGRTITFSDKSGFLVEEQSGNCAGYSDAFPGGVLCRIGYDLFEEVRELLTTGQPAANAAIPTVEHHIAVLRNLILESGISLTEIPPVPRGYEFIACLTHDVDHPAIRWHTWDHTLWGFLYRAVVGSLRNLIRGRVSAKFALSNLMAACKLPFIYLGLAKDFWRDFDDRYLELEGGLPSTFFVIPFRNRSGSRPNGPAPRFRATRYGARDIGSTIIKLLRSGCEIGLHGIDAWLDEARGREEIDEIRSLVGRTEIGVRMHWLYYDRGSPARLEQAGASYDSTIGYNETVGYRAGTTQVYKPIGAINLLELPLHVMDTALFYPAYLGLSEQRATDVLNQMLNDADRFGGCFTINWHDRSLAPERCWRTQYSELIRELKARGAWFASARDVVSWFRKRRSVVFEKDGSVAAGVRAEITLKGADNTPQLRLRTYRRTAGQANSEGSDSFLEETVGFEEVVSMEDGK